MQHHSSNNQITPAILSDWLTPNSTIIVGFSGGPDSTALLHMLKQQEKRYKLTIIAAHLNHGWRKDADADQAWCADFCVQNNITYIGQQANQLDLTIHYNGSKEEVGRKLRRHFFQTLAQQYQADAIMLAHHQDDQIETFFIRLLRGSSITGLAGIKQHDGLYVRPLLNVTKDQILSYLQQHDITYLTDATNESPLFLRNRIRHTLPAAFNAIDARWSQKIPELMHHLQETDEFLEQHAAQQRANMSVEQKINLAEFLKLHIIIQYRILMQLLIEHKVTAHPSKALLCEILRFLQTSKQPRHVIDQATIIKEKNYFYCK